MRFTKDITIGFLIWLVVACAAQTSAALAATNPAQETNKENASESDAPNRRLSVSFIGIGGELLENVKQRVRLYARLKDDSPLSRSERRRLERYVAEEVILALQPFGYYSASVQLEANEDHTKLIYQVTLNQPVMVKEVAISINGSSESERDFRNWLTDYSLKEGDILDQAKYELDKKTLLARALRLGYFGAKLDKNTIVINQDRTQANIEMVFNSGPRYVVGDIETIWDSENESGDDYRKRIEGRLLESYITVKSGEKFDADKLIETQSSLLATPYFANVAVQAGDLNSETAAVPIQIKLTPKKRNAYSAEVGFGTDTGVRGGIGYENRRINSRGHNLSLRLGASNIRRSAILNYQVPKADSVKDSLNFFAALEEEVGNARRFESFKIGAEYIKEWNDALLSFGLTASREEFLRALEDGIESEQKTDLVMPRLRWEKTKVDDPYFPSRGWTASASIRGASETLGSDIDLAQLIVEAKYLLPFGPGRLKLRLKAAGSVVDDSIVLPESLGFLAGGDDSIRGYRFESIGVETDGETRVANNLLVGSIEYQHPIRNDIALASFIDAGDAFDNDIDLRKGVGVGLRWRLPFGAVRLDIASALDLDGKPLRVHFGFGTDL